MTSRAPHDPDPRAARRAPAGLTGCAGARIAPARLAERARRHRARGEWRDVSIGDWFIATCAARGSATALIEGDRALDFERWRADVLAVAASLEALGVRPGDAVAYQLPNWHEAAIALLAALRVGAHAVPIVAALREREVGFILRETAPRVVFAAEQHRGVDCAAQIERACPGEAPAPRVIVVRPQDRPAPGQTDFRELLATQASAPPSGEAVDPDGLAVIIYTSGSTAAPKGVLHTHNTLGAELASLIDAHRLGPSDRVLMPSPLTHISGVVHGILGPALLGTSAVLMDRWEAGAGLAAIERHRVTYMIGAPTFLQEMLAHPDVATRDLSSLRLYSCGGASVPPELLRRARERIPAMVAKRVYGSSEFPTIATTTAADAASRGLDTEGRALGGVEIAIADPDGRRLPAGREGEIRALGPECFLGYADPSLDPATFDAEGFLCTGDLGVLDEDGYLRVTGRVKDIIVRKGEKISAREIEDLLDGLPGLAEAAVVPLADPATGERACACLLLRPGAHPPELSDVAAYLRARGLTTHKLPEAIAVLDEFPRTPSGKVHKRLLREQVEASAQPQSKG